MEEVKKEYHVKVDLKKFFGPISTEDLRSMRDAITEVLKARAKEARKNRPPSKPEFHYWTGKIVRRTGDAFCRYRFRLELCCPEEVPEELRDKAELIYFPLLSGSFKKDTCPKIGDVVRLKYRVLKRCAASINFSRSKIVGLAPKKVVGCARDWNCLNIIAYNDKSLCPNCPDAVKE